MQRFPKHLMGVSLKAWEGGLEWGPLGLGLLVPQISCQIGRAKSVKVPRKGEPSSLVVVGSVR